MCDFPAVHWIFIEETQYWNLEHQYSSVGKVLLGCPDFIGRGGGCPNLGKLKQSFYLRSPEVEPWVFRWTFSPPPPPSPPFLSHLQLGPLQRRPVPCGEGEGGIHHTPPPPCPPPGGEFFFFFSFFLFYLLLLLLLLLFIYFFGGGLLNCRPWVLCCVCALVLCLCSLSCLPHIAELTDLSILHLEDPILMAWQTALYRSVYCTVV